jgi:uncharacterized membrane protein (DUF373 family)
MKSVWKILKQISDDDFFLGMIAKIENILAKILVLVLLLVIGVSVFQLIVYTVHSLGNLPTGNDIPLEFTQILLYIFSLILNVLIALEVLENVTAYLRKHVIQIQLVIATALTAVARKIIVFDGKEKQDLSSLAYAALALALAYWVIRFVTRKDSANH